MKHKNEKNTDKAPEDARIAVHTRVLEQLRIIRRRGTPEQAIEAAELEKIVMARSEDAIAA